MAIFIWLSIATYQWMYLQRSVEASLAASGPIHIGCGSLSAFISDDGVQYQADDRFLGGNATTSANSSVPRQFQSLRYFPLGTVPCYDIPVQSGRYLVRVGILSSSYDNGQNDIPIFNIYVNGALVDRYDPFNTNSLSYNSNSSGIPYYADFLTFATSNLSICFGENTGDPFINTLEVFPADSSAFLGDGINSTDILRSVSRVNYGGPAIAATSDPGNRIWSGQSSHLNLTTTRNISRCGPSAAPDYFPESLFQTSIYSRINFSVSNAVSPAGKGNRWLIRLHFAEVRDYTSGTRIFDIAFSASTSQASVSKDVTGVDIRSLSGLYNATSFSAVLELPVTYGSALVTVTYILRKNISGKYAVILNGAEVYEVIDASRANATALQQELSTEGTSTLREREKQKKAFGVLLGVFLIVFCLLLLFGLCGAIFCLMRRQRQHQGIQNEQEMETPTYVARVGSLSSLFPRGLSISGSYQAGTGRGNSYERSSGGNFF